MLMENAIIHLAEVQVLRFFWCSNILDVNPPFDIIEQFRIMTETGHEVEDISK